ncbi:MAG: Hsp70 family protein, partial [Caulobacterales bacterium]|nr:Hsp70 family protein [Caulobacterales bacterium]
GIVSVSAKDKATNKEQSIRIQANGGLSDADIEQMVKDAEANADADKKRRESVEAKNSAEASIHSVEKQLNEYGSKLEDGDKGAIEAAIAKAKDAVQGGEVEAMQAATNDLMQAAMKIGEVMYKEQQAAEEAAAGADAQRHAAADGEDIVDAEFEDVDGDKK